MLDAQKRSKEETAELEKERGERAEMRERLEAEREGRRKKEEQARQEADKERNEADRQRLEQERLEQERQAVEQRKAEERRAGRVKEMERNREMQKDLKLKEQIRQMANFCPGITPDQSKFLLESYVRGGRKNRGTGGGAECVCMCEGVCGFVFALAVLFCRSRFVLCYCELPHVCVSLHVQLIPHSAVPWAQPCTRPCSMFANAVAETPLTPQPYPCLCPSFRFDFKFEQAVNAYFQGQGQGK